MSNASTRTVTHVVDILGNVRGRDQPIMLIKKATELVSYLDKEVFCDDDVVFFDPFCKAGEILLSCAYLSAKYSSEKDTKLFNVETIQNDLFVSGRYFALSPDERHHKISLRTFLGNEHSHNPKYTHIIKNGNYLSEVDGTLNKEKFKMEFESMIDYIKKTSGKNKIIAIGNPPYQEDDDGDSSGASPIYQFFVETLIDSGHVDQFVFVIPARWFSAGKGLLNFRKRIMESNQVVRIQYFEKAEKVFPTVQVKGGVCFLHWKKSYNGKPVFAYGDSSAAIDLSQYDIIPDDPISTPIVDKVLKQSLNFVSSVAQSRKVFGLATNHFENKVTSEGKNKIKVYTTGRKIHFINRDEITKNPEMIDLYKVAIPKAYGKGMRRCTLPKEHIFIIEKGEISTETYNIVGCFKGRAEALRFQAYLQTDFSRFLLGLRKLTQDIPKDRWNWVPLMDTSKTWTDEELFKHFKLTKAEQDHIKSKVKEWS